METCDEYIMKRKIKINERLMNLICVRVAFLIVSIDCFPFLGEEEELE